MFLVFGKSGWIGGLLIDYLQRHGFTVFGAESRLEDREACARCVQPRTHADTRWHAQRFRVLLTQ